MIYYRDRAIPILTIPPNWGRPVKLVEDWGGLVREAMDVSEERQGNYPRPLYKIEYETLALTAQETGYIRRMLQTDTDMPIGVAAWQSQVRLTADVLALTPYVTVEDTAGGLFDVLPYALLWHSFNEFDVVTTAAVGPNQVQFAEGVAADFIEGDFLVPLTVGKLRRPNAVAVTDAHGKFGVRFEEAFLNQEPYIEADISGTDQYAMYSFEMQGVGGPGL